MKKPYRWTMLFTSLLLLLSSCSPAPTPTLNPNQEINNQRITITIWLLEQDNDFYSRLAEDFERVNLDINIFLKEIPETDYVSRIDEELSHGAGPDIALLKTSRWLVNGDFLPLNKEIQQHRILINDFNQGAWHGNCVYNKLTFCLGTYTSAYILFYNMDLFDQFGIPYPRTNGPISISEYSALVQGFGEGKSTHAQKIWGSSFPPPFLWLDRNSHFSSDGRRIYRFVNDEPTINTYQSLSDLCQNEIASCDFGEEDHSSKNLELFTLGKLATLIAGIQASLPAIEQSGIKWGAAVVPTETKEDSKWTTAWTDGFGVLRTTQHKEEAIKFLAYLGTRGSELRSVLGDPPLNMKSGISWAGENPSRQQVLEAILAAHEDLFIPDSASVANLLQSAFSRTIEEKISAQDALDEVAFAVQDVLDQSWAVYDRVVKK